MERPNDHLSLSQTGLELIKHFEGLRLAAYEDGGGVPTIGYGHTGNVLPGQRISEDAADTLLRKDVAHAESVVWRSVSVDLTQPEFDALVSFVYNVGRGAFRQSTLLKRLNEGKRSAVIEQFVRWHHDNGKDIYGLAKRRAAEASLFANGRW